jgi:hypothetical protein
LEARLDDHSGKGAGHVASRRRFIELHEQTWFPESARDAVTSALQFGLNKLGVYSCIVPVIRRSLGLVHTNQVIDMCSGGGGPWSELQTALDSSGTPVKVRLTDKFPNLPAFRWAATSSQQKITFDPKPVDATKMGMKLKGFRTMFTSFHHFSVKPAQGILQDAVDAGAGIGIFEASARKVSSIAMMFLWALSQFFFAPFIRPFTWPRLFWTYVIPLVPFVVLFDGIVTCLRSYSPAEMLEIANRTSGEAYRWEAGICHDGFFHVPITFLVGYPVVEKKIVQKVGN